MLDPKGAPHAGRTPSIARDILWTLTSYDIYRRLVVERRWTADQYERWLGDTLIATLMGPGKKDAC